MRGADTVRSAAMPALGMSMFWPFFRYASFFMVLYPAGTDVAVGGAHLAAHIACLLILAVLACVALGAWRTCERLLTRNRAATACLMGLAAPGAALALAARGGALPAGLLWASAVLAAIGFLASYLAWAAFFSRGFGPRDVAVLGVSFFLSYVLFSHGGLVGGLLHGAVGTVAMPVGTSVAWLLSRRAPDMPDQPDSRTAPPPDLRRFVSLPVLAVAAFLVIGAAVRGIVDLHSADGNDRMGISLALSALLALGCLGLWRAYRAPTTGAGNGGHGRDEETDAPFFLATTRFALVCWIALSLVFLGGLLAFLTPGQPEFGGHVVIVARTVMEFVLWMLLCSLATERRLPSTPLFLTCGLSVEIVSWLLSYGVAPEVVGGAGTPVLAPSTFILAVMFGIAACVLVVCGLGLVLGKVPFDPSDQLPATNAGCEDGTGGKNGTPTAVKTAASPAAQAQDALVGQLVEREHLTYREASVVALYAHGYSLGKVAEELGITKSTAQSHVKNAYRKLGVHSKDELIERLGA